MDANTLTTLREEAKLAMRRNDQLGFDTMFGALCAVLGHDDWSSRWEVEFPSDVVLIARWRRAHLAQGQTAPRGWDKVGS